MTTTEQGDDAGLGPTDAAHRVALLDVLRGLALFGVLYANAVPWFSGRAFMTRAELIARTTPADDVTLFLTGLFVDGKAMTMLTFLFGLGFALQLERAAAKGRSVVRTHLRRLGALALIGVCHVLLLWWGDIVWGYAIAGAGLLLFRRVKGWGLFAAALALVFVPQFVVSIPAVAEALAPLVPHPADDGAFRAKLLAAIAGDDRLALAEMHVKQAYYHVGRIWVSYFVALLGKFLLGYWAGTTGLLPPAEGRLPFHRKLLAWGLALGLVFSVIMPVRRILMRRGVVIPEDVRMALGPLSEAGTMLLASAYVAAIVLLMRRPFARRALLLVAPVGRMALTTYLFQSLVCTFLFYGWGLGLAGRVGPAVIFPMTLAVFLLQIALSTAWLRRFRFGPVEWVWRWLTYGRMPPMRAG